MGRPNPRSWIPLERKLSEGRRVAQLVAEGRSIRQAAEELGMPLTTAWRRLWFVRDYASRKDRRIPRQRGTAARPPAPEVIVHVHGNAMATSAELARAVQAAIRRGTIRRPPEEDEPGTEDDET
jgi:molybdenum-dependent DNA-binding transcriptional regulator ModE